MSDITITIHGGNNQILPNATEAIQNFYVGEYCCLSGIITPYCRRRILHDDSLLLRGLALIWRKNCGNR